MNRRAVVFGASGQLGIEVVRELRTRNYTVEAWERSQVDISDPAAVENALASSEAEIVYNCAAYNQVDVAEKEPLAAIQVNALAVRNLALACRQLDARLVHFSTDYVFDGTAAQPYTEEVPTHPLSAYAVSKLAGELYAQAYLDRVLLVRTCGVFGPGGRHTARGNFVELMLRMAASGRPIRVVEDHIASPTFAPWLADRSISLAEAGHNGIFHIGGGTPIAWFGFARMIFDVAGLSPELTPTDEREYRTPARRPKYSALSNSKMERAGIAPMRPLREAVETYFAGRELPVSGSRA
ncbi:MAG: dTDP-4-dehydrorhamnose reductase [Acidobacteriia bacterium]|nr:dTDP-4-dehydrorhamnose reductase [Terriglobia bacterium]